MEYYSASQRENIEYNVNQTKDMIITKLIEDGLIEEKKAIEWAKTHCVIIRQPNFLSRFLKKSDDLYKIHIANI